MKYRHIIISLVALLTALLPGCRAGAENRGIPFLRNYTAQEYNAQNSNTDVACDDYGTVYFANFEGIVYFDGSLWRKVHSPGISRVTHLVKDNRRGKIWFGGYNLFGYLVADKNGCLQMKTIASDNSNDHIGEVDMIYIEGKDVFVHCDNGKCYKLVGNKLQRYLGNTSFIELSMDKISLKYTGKIHMVKNPEGGLLIADATRRRTITEADGLCSNNILFPMFDQHHTLWGATDHGVFGMEIPSPFSHLTEKQGLNGEVKAINEIGQTIYVGTIKGLYRVDNGKVTKVPGINSACWELKNDGANALIASTMEGLCRVTQSGLTPITHNSTMSACLAPQGGYYVAELDGLCYVSKDGTSTIVSSDILKGSKTEIIGDVLKVETVYGKIWHVVLSGGKFKATKVRDKVDLKAPKISYTDCFGRHWSTDFQGKNIEVNTNTSDKLLRSWIHPFKSYSLNAIFCSHENSLWVGGDFGIINCDLSMVRTIKNTNSTEPVYIRRICIMGDSILWGGYTPGKLVAKSNISGIVLPSDCRRLIVNFSARYNSFFVPTQYRYRINNGRWSAWSTETDAEFNNMSYGETVFEVEGLDLFGNISKKSTVEWYVEYPFYMKWYACIVYLLLIAGIVRLVMRYKERKLEADKARLESLVKKRTAELSNTLDELKHTQDDLVRMERTATAGKLTQGLIDRILNPINYINNFSKLTKGLAKDLRDDIEDERDNMSEDNYDDSQDVLNMMTQNLTKIEEHGVNATRTLRAMEAMLNTRVGTLRKVDIVMLCKQVYEVTAEYYKKEIDKYHIAFTHQIPNGELEHEIDPESFNNVLKAMMSNAFYAVVRKCQREQYDAQVELRLAKLSENHIEIIIHDNGVGIEESIKEKVFDPFFTTKPTGEAAGVGLYLAREIIQDHKGTVTLESLKDNYTNFIISL